MELTPLMSQVFESTKVAHARALDLLNKADSMGLSEFQDYVIANPITDGRVLIQWALAYKAQQASLAAKLAASKPRPSRLSPDAVKIINLMVKVRRADSAILSTFLKAWLWESRDSLHLTKLSKNCYRVDDENNPDPNYTPAEYTLKTLKKYWTRAG